jgi:hypothetical protein
MQPPFLIDWLRQLHLTADAGLAAKRWKLAEAFVEKVTRKECLQLLRIFLFPEAATQHLQSLTQQFLSVDTEFPASNNTEEVRLMAGIVMVGAVQKRSSLADAFALGMKAAAFPKHRCNPAQRGIVEEMGKHLDTRANDLRPSDVHTTADRDAIVEKLESFGAEAGGDNAPALKKAAEGVAETLDMTYGVRMQRLSEETGLLWWLLGGRSSELDREVFEMAADAYALIAAKEAADRTYILPPPPSIYAILGQSLKHCKGSKKKNPTLKDAIAATDAAWRSKFAAAHSIADCGDLVPIVTSLTKVEDSGDIGVLPKALQKACPGVAADLALPPPEAARQLYNELMFLKAIARLN